MIKSVSRLSASTIPPLLSLAILGCEAITAYDPKSYKTVTDLKAEALLHTTMIDLVITLASNLI